MEKVDRRVRRTQQQLGKALIELAKEKGYDAVTIKDITERADVAYITFFRHYKKGDKHALLADMVKEIAGDIERIAREGQQFSHEKEGCLMFEHAKQHRDLFSIVLNSQGGLAVRQQIIKDMTALIRSHLAHHQRDDGAIPIDIAAHHIATALLSLVEWWLANDLPYSAERMGEVYAQLIVRPALPSGE